MKSCYWLIILITMSLCQDVCPSGHLFLGLASLAPLLVPGLMYSLTTFLHYQGDIMQCGLGKPFNIPSSKLGEYSLPSLGLIISPPTLTPHTSTC